MLKEKDLRTAYIVTLLLFAGLLAYMLRDFLDAFLGAVIFYVLFRPMVKYLCEKRKWKRGMAALAVLVLSFLIVLVPIFMLTYMLVSKLSLFFGDTSMIMKTLGSVESAIREATGFVLFSEENIRALQGRAAQYVTTLLSESFSMVGDVALMYFFLYYLLANYGRLGQALWSMLPMQGKNVQVFVDGLKSMTFSNALGAPVLALLQGAVAGIGYWIFGVDEPVFWGLMTGFFSFVPVVGSTIIWLPAGIVQIMGGHTVQGVGILLYGILVISVVDNVFRFVLQKRFADVHPLITVLGVIAGISWFGVPGIIFGPLLISYFILLLNLYRQQFPVTQPSPPQAPPPAGGNAAGKPSA